MNMNRKLQFGLILIPLFFITACGSKPEAPVESEVSAPEEIVDETTDNELVEETVVTPEPADEVETVEEFFDDDEVEFIDEADEEDEEYLRSTDNLTEGDKVTRSEFADDKTAIINIINNLSTVISTQNYQEWQKYIDQESKDYYSNPANLRAAQKKLPNKTIQLKGLRDYFINVFIPSRQRSSVDEIRYISRTNIKAVQVKPDLSTIVYYYFVKIDGKWYVHIPPVN